MFARQQQAAAQSNESCGATRAPAPAQCAAHTTKTAEDDDAMRRHETNSPAPPPIRVWRGVETETKYCVATSTGCGSSATVCKAFNRVCLWRNVHSTYAVTFAKSLEVMFSSAGRHALSVLRCSLHALQTQTPRTVNSELPFAAYLLLLERVLVCVCVSFVAAPVRRSTTLQYFGTLHKRHGVSSCHVRRRKSTFNRMYCRRPACSKLNGMHTRDGIGC